VTVTTSQGTSAVSPPGDQYTFEAKPTVTAISPGAGSPSGGTSVTITGMGFVSGATVKFGTVVATTVCYDSATQMLASAPAHAAGTVDLTVTTPGGTTPTSTADRRRSPRRCRSAGSAPRAGRSARP
jgi:hypothetical protein